MSQEFREGKLGLIEKFFELNQKMFFYNKTLSASHDFGSRAFGWPLMVRAVYYWVEDMGEKGISRIYFSGNPVLWFLGLIGLFNLVFLKIQNQENKERKNILILLYLANFLPFVLVTRVLFLYHYLVAMIVSVLIFWFVFNEQIQELKTRRFWLSAVLFLVISSFLFFAPLSYGFPLTEKQFSLRQWFPLSFSTNSGLKNICQNTNCSVLKLFIY
jgi:dolichyl-phosphate-mannose--protein O-mannosyl transferase